MHANSTRSFRRQGKRVLASLDHDSERILTELFADADIGVAGARPEDLVVHDKAFFTRVLRDGSVGFGQS